VDNIIIGEVRLAGFDGVPDGWAACDGQRLPIAEYRALFAVIGTTYGGDGRTTFALPDLRGRVAIHNDSAGLALGASGGAERHALALAELPAHQHELLLAPPAADGVGSEAVSYLTDSAVTEIGWTDAHLTAASAAGHDNMQPYLGLIFMIALGRSQATRH